MLIRTDEKITINADNITCIVVEKAKNDRWAINIYDAMGCHHTMHTYSSEQRADEARFWLEHWLVKPPVTDIVITARHLTPQKFREFYHIGYDRRFSTKKIAEAEEQAEKPEE